MSGQICSISSRPCSSLRQELRPARVAGVPVLDPAQQRRLMLPVLDLCGVVASNIIQNFSVALLFSSRFVDLRALVELMLGVARVAPGASFHVMLTILGRHVGCCCRGFMCCMVLDARQKGGIQGCPGLVNKWPS